MRVLAYVSPARGDLYPLIPTLLELKGRGHDVSICALSGEVAGLERLGFEARPLAPGVEDRQQDDWRGRGPLAKIHRALLVFVDRAEAEVADVRTAIAETSPDLLLLDVNSWGAQAVAEASGLPWAVFAPYPLPIPSRDAPPFGMGLKPMAGPVGRLRDRSLLKLSLIGWNRVLPRYNAMRRLAGAGPLASVADLFGRAPLTIAYTAEPFEYSRSDWPASVRLVGPSCWEPAAEAPAWLGEIDRPVILVTTSTEFQGDDRLVQTALDALAGEPYTVVATCPSGEAAGFRVPANARVERFVPHGPILKLAACVVCHGGMGITQKALAAGVPVCVVPFGRDQPEVARRVEVARAGTRLPAGRLNPERLRKAVLEAIQMRPGAERVARAFAEAPGPAGASGALEGLLFSGGTHRQGLAAG